MRTLTLLVLAFGVVACEPMAPSGDPLAPVTVVAGEPRLGSGSTDKPTSTSSAPSATAAPSVLDDDTWSDAEIEAAKRATAADDDDPIARQAALMGVPVPEPAPDAPVESTATRAEPVNSPLPSLPSLPVASPPPADFGVRLVQVLADVQPPRAILGLADGSEIVVQAGAFVDAHRLVVLAIGRDAVQVARIVPEGYYARVEPQTLTPLFGGSAR